MKIVVKNRKKIIEKKNGQIELEYVFVCLLDSYIGRLDLFKWHVLIGFASTHNGLLKNPARDV